MRLVRGPLLKLPPHPEHIDDESAFVEYAKSVGKKTEALLAAD